MRTSGLLLCGVLLCSALHAADTPNVDALIQSARTVPAEFEADALIRIAGIPSLDRVKKVQLLDRAFERAGAAQQPHKRRAALVRMKGPINFFNKVNDQDLDALSLRLRAVDAMLPLDGKHARELFLKIPALKIPRLTCEDFAVPDVNHFYSTLGAIAAQTGDNVKLVQRYAGDVQSPVQIEGIAKILTGMNAPDVDLLTLVSIFSTSMGKLKGDDRSFTYSRNIVQAMESLVAECKRKKVSPLPLIESYRLYLVVHLTASRCADDDLMDGGGLSTFTLTGQGVDQGSMDFIASFNDRLRMPPLQKIQEQESTPSRLEGVAASLRSCEDDECKAAGELYKKLILSEKGAPIPPAQRSTEAWSAQYRELIGALDAWKVSAHASPLEHFRERVSGYSDLLNLAPAGPDREAGFHALTNFLTKNPIASTNRADWFLPVNALIARATLDPPGFGKYAEELRKSENPVIALYAKLEVLAPRPPEKVIPLL